MVAHSHLLESLQDEHTKYTMKNILIVESNSTINDMLSYLFEIEGYTISTFTDERAAGVWLEQALSNNQAPSSILLNFSEQHEDGRWFLQHFYNLQEKYHPLPSLVIMTADIRNYHELGVPVLHKPFHIRQLIDTLRALE